MMEPGGPVKISVIVPLYNARSTLAACLAGIASSNYLDFELIIVDDGSTDGSQAIAQEYSHLFIQLAGGPYGPALARNRGAEAARGEILFFVDSDVVIYPDTLTIIDDAFECRPEYSALFGSYDDEPGDSGFLSQYKNLTHAFVHQKAREEGSTFWSGCGAVKKSVFMQLGGFDVKNYPRPSIEDIELGCRIKANDGRIWVNKQVKVKHLKRWTFRGLVRTDIFDRAIPWTLLILRNRDLPNDLNLSGAQRVSAALAALLVIGTTLSVFQVGVFLGVLITVALLLSANYWQWKAGQASLSITAWKIIAAILVIGLCLWLAWNNRMVYVLPALVGWLVISIALPGLRNSSSGFQRAAMIALNTTIALSYILVLFYLPDYYSIPAFLLLLGIFLINRELYRFLNRRNGIIFASAAIPMQLFYYLYSLAAFIIGILIYLWVTLIKPKLSFLRHEQSA